MIIVFKKDLEKDVAGDTSGDFCKLLLALIEVIQLGQFVSLCVRKRHGGEVLKFFVEIKESNILEWGWNKMF